jgi:hypothetical protein
MSDNENLPPRPPQVHDEPVEESPPVVTNAFEKSEADLTEVVKAVARGEYGEGQALRDRLREEGYDHRVIRKKIVELYRR